MTPTHGLPPGIAALILGLGISVSQWFHFAHDGVRTLTQLLAAVAFPVGFPELARLVVLVEVADGDGMVLPFTQPLQLVNNLERVVIEAAAVGEALLAHIELTDPLSGRRLILQDPPGRFEEAAGEVAAAGLGERNEIFT